MNTTSSNRTAQTDQRRVVAPAVDIIEDSERGRFEIVVDLPGIDEASLDVGVRDGELTIHARWGAESADGKLWSFESPARDFRRVFRLNDDVNVEGISASYKSGVLVVDVPLVLKKQPRKIDVKVVQ